MSLGTVLSDVHATWATKPGSILETNAGSGTARNGGWLRKGAEQRQGICSGAGVMALANPPVEVHCSHFVTYLPPSLSTRKTRNRRTTLNTVVPLKVVLVQVTAYHGTMAMRSMMLKGSITNLNLSGADTNLRRTGDSKCNRQGVGHAVS